jgi:hypothetical protein
MCQGARDIKKIAGVSINPDPEAHGNSPIAVLNRFAKMVNLKFECVGTEAHDGIPRRLYQLQTLDPDGRAAIFERWGKASAPESPPAHDPAPSCCTGDLIQQDPYKYKIKHSDLVVLENQLLTNDPAADPFDNFQVGQRVKLWHDVLQNWIDSEIKAVFPGQTGFLKIGWLNGLGGDYCFGRDKLEAGRLAIAPGGGLAHA